MQHIPLPPGGSKRTTGENGENEEMTDCIRFHLGRQVNPYVPPQSFHPPGVAGQNNEKRRIGTLHNLIPPDIDILYAYKN